MLVRLCYASMRVGQQDGLLEDVFNILTTARNFNIENNIFGVLYYADNTFFQCIEGDKEVIEKLFEKIKLDRRHHNIRHFGTTEIESISFKNWSMKYVKRASSIDEFLKSRGCEKFEPHSLLDDDLPNFMEHLFIAQQEDEKPKNVRHSASREANPNL